MKRRDFVRVVGIAAVWPLSARTQQAAIPRVGYVTVNVRGNVDPSSAGLRQGLADRGYEIGRDLIFEERFADGHPEKIPSLIAELLALNIDVLVTVGTPVSRAAQRATTTVPIVCMSGDPVGSKLVASLAHPGGNITGMSFLSSDYSPKWLAFLREAVPRLRRVAVLSDPDNPANAAEHDQMRNAAPDLSLELTPLSSRAMELEKSLASLQTANFDGFVATDDPSLEPLLARLVKLAAHQNLPALYAYSEAVKLGGLMSYSVDFFKMWRQTAFFVDRILKGARPADLPVQQATEFTLNVNLSTAKALGLNIPQTLLATANEVIE
jgi:putative ABC transport system substrate-binding protein